MTDTALLKQKIEESGYKLKFIAQRLELTYQGLLKKINNESEFKASEISVLAELLRLSDKERDNIFFCTKCR